MNNAIIIINDIAIPQHLIKEIIIEEKEKLMEQFSGWYIIIKTDNEEYESLCYKTETKCRKAFKTLCEQLGTCVYL